MAKRIFKKEDLQAIVSGDLEGAKVLEDNITDHRRWSVDHECVFAYEGKHYICHYSVGATESQDETPFQYDDDLITLDEVEQQEVTTTEWVILPAC